VLQNISDTVISIVIPSGAHHSDLMFQNALDGEDVLAARRLEVHFFCCKFSFMQRSMCARGGCLGSAPPRGTDSERKTKVPFTMPLNGILGH